VYICICHGISDRRLRQAVSDGAQSFDDLQASTGVGSCCGACEPSVRELVDECRAEGQPRREPAILD
jgi:bacterioferritin-associated ferredoxin